MFFGLFGEDLFKKSCPCHDRVMHPTLRGGSNPMIIFGVTPFRTFQIPLFWSLPKVEMVSKMLFEVLSWSLKKFVKKIFFENFESKKCLKIKVSVIFSKKKTFLHFGLKMRKNSTSMASNFVGSNATPIIFFLGLRSNFKGHILWISCIQITYSTLSKFFPEKKNVSPLRPDDVKIPAVWIKNLWKINLESFKSS